MSATAGNLLGKPVCQEKMHVWADVMRWDCLLEQALFHEKVGGWTYTNVGIVASHLTPVGLSSAGDTTTLGNVLVVVVEKVVILGHDAHHDADGPQYLPMDVVSRHVLFLLLWPVALLAPLWSKWVEVVRIVVPGKKSRPSPEKKCASCTAGLKTLERSFNTVEYAGDYV